MVRNRNQHIGIGREIDPYDLRLLVHDMIDETRVLMAETVVVLPPNMGSEKVIQ